MKGSEIIRSYPIALDDNPVGHKQREGDEKTPIGTYILDWRNRKSICYKSIHISYPSEQDKLNAHQSGVSPGGNIMIHGLPESMAWLGKFHAFRDWTNGCVGISNNEMDEIWLMVKNGTLIEINE